MAAITLAQAQSHLQSWLDADIALTEGQSYAIDVAGSRRTLTRADAAEVRKNIDYWSSMVTRLQRGSRAPRVRLAVPRD